MLSWNLGASTSWNPQGLSRPVQGLLYLLLGKLDTRIITYGYTTDNSWLTQQSCSRRSGKAECHTRWKWVCMRSTTGKSVEMWTPTYWNLITLSIITQQLCYISAVFFCHLCVTALSFPQGKIWHVFQTCYSSDFLKFFLKMHQVWNCAHWGVLVNNGNGHGTPTDVTWVHKPEKIGNTGHILYATHHVNWNWQDWDTQVPLCCCQFWQYQIGNCSRQPILVSANAPNASCYADCDHHQQVALTKVYTHKTFSTSGAI